MRKMYFALLVLIPLSSFATDVKGRLSITPIVGLERVQKFQPTTSMKTRAIYGATAVYRFPISALEVEYTHGQDTDTNAATNTTYKDSEDKIRVGLRGSFNLGTFFSYHLRGGAQGRKNEHTTTVGTATSTTSTSSKVQPYVGTGIEIHLMQYFSLSASVLATYAPTSDPNLKDYELQPALGINLRF